MKLYLSLLLFIKYTYCSLLLFSSPLPYSELIIGSTTSFQWKDHSSNSSGVMLDIYLTEPNVMHRLARHVNISEGVIKVTIPATMRSQTYTVLVKEADTNSPIATIKPVFLIKDLIDTEKQHIITTPSAEESSIQKTFYEPGMTLSSIQVVIISFSMIGIVLVLWPIFYIFTKDNKKLNDDQHSSVLLEKL